MFSLAPTPVTGLKYASTIGSELRQLDLEIMSPCIRIFIVVKHLFNSDIYFDAGSFSGVLPVTSHGLSTALH
jgi:hypothetical protein